MSSGSTQRRLAAILAAHVVGYYRLIGKDETRTLATFKAARTELIDPKVLEHTGRVTSAESLKKSLSWPKNAFNAGLPPFLPQYSRLMAANEVGTLAALKEHRHELIDSMIAQHEGRIVKLAGDGMLVEFRSVVNTVECATKIQRDMRTRNADVPEDRRIEFRIGINLGDIIVEGDDIFGDGVNVAARLESIAPPGGVAVSGTVRDHL